MKNIMIFLHGKGVDQDDERYNIVNEIANKKNAKLIKIHAQTPYKEGYKWFEKTKRLGEPEVLEQFKNSVEYLKSKIDEILEEEKCLYKDIILCGHSQGALMSIYFGLTYGAKEVISLCGGLHSSFISRNLKKDIPIYWIEAEFENVLDDNIKSSYKQLKEMGCNINHFLSVNSTHDELDNNILNFL